MPVWVLNSWNVVELSFTSHFFITSSLGFPLLICISISAAGSQDKMCFCHFQDGAIVLVKGKEWRQDVIGHYTELS